MIELNDSNFQEETSEGLVLVDFYAPWCGPCKMMEPVLDELEEEVDAKIVKVNIDECSDAVSEYGIQSVPTFVILKDGDEVETVCGTKPKDYFVDLLS